MIILWGTHHYGKVHGHGTEYLATRFGHLYWFPLFPIESRWVTESTGNPLLGFQVKMSWRSVGMTYARFWSPLIAIIAAATMSIVGIAAAVALLALCAWSWTTRNVRSGRELRRAQLNLIAFGTACDPMLRTHWQCEGLRADAAMGFAEVSDGRSPDDVARLGADTPMQAALAYASLRLVAATVDGERGRRAREASDRIVDRLTDREASALVEGGPYRSKAHPGESAGDVETAAAAVMQHNGLAKKTGSGISRLGWVGIFAACAAFAGWIGFEIYTDHQAAKKAFAELEAFTDELCRCTSSTCATEVVRGRIDELEALDKKARDGLISDREVNDLAKRAEACMDRALDLPP